MAVGLLIPVAVKVLSPGGWEHVAHNPLEWMEQVQLSTGSTLGVVLEKTDTLVKDLTVVYLHGGPGACTTPEVVKALRPLKAQGFHLLFYDQVGSGGSKRLHHINEYKLDRHVADLKALLDTQGLQKVVLLGQSWGAILASHFTGRYPDRVDRLVLSSPGPLYPIIKDRSAVKAPDSLRFMPPAHTNAEANQKWATWRTKTTLFLARYFGTKLMSDSEADAFQNWLNHDLNKSTTAKDTTMDLFPRGGQGFYAQWMTFYSLDNATDPRATLKRFPRPVLVMKGEYDNQSWGATSEYLELFPKATLRYCPGAGHSLLKDAPEWYTNTLFHFLKS